MLNLRVCDKCRDVKSLFSNVDLPSALADNVNEYFQRNECDASYKRDLKNEQRRIYYKENEDRIIEKAHCYKVRKMAMDATPINTFIINEMNKILEILKCNKNMELYWNLVNDFMVNFHDRYAGI